MPDPPSPRAQLRPLFAHNLGRTLDAARDKGVVFQQVLCSGASVFASGSKRSGPYLVPVLITYSGDDQAIHLSLLPEDQPSVRWVLHPTAVDAVGGRPQEVGFVPECRAQDYRHQPSTPALQRYEERFGGVPATNVRTWGDFPHVEITRHESDRWWERARAHLTVKPRSERFA